MNHSLIVGAMLTILAALGAVTSSNFASSTTLDRPMAAKKLVEDATQFALQFGEPGTPQFTSAFRVFVADRGASSENKAVREQIEDLSGQWNDEAFNQNFQSLAVRAALNGDLAARIIGGEPDRDHPECVAVGDHRGWFGSGILISERVVLTARHVAQDKPTRIWVGTHIGINGGELQLDKSIQEYAPSGADLAIIVLDKPCSTTEPKKDWATVDESNGAADVFAVGFGSVEEHGRGDNRERRIALLANTRANPCSDESDQDTYGCESDVEFVSGGAGKDTCRRDSGGPAYLENDDKLVGITSRPVKETPRGHCGLGGVFTRVAEHAGWMNEVIEKYR